jgi:hypothetical protein
MKAHRIEAKLTETGTLTKVIRYDDPFDSAIPVEDWEVLQ